MTVGEADPVHGLRLRLTTDPRACWIHTTGPLPAADGGSRMPVHGAALVEGGSLAFLTHRRSDGRRAELGAIGFGPCGAELAHVITFWVILSAGLAIALGTYIGGWRIIQTLGKRVSEIQTPQGFAAETSATAVILASSHLGFALSTTRVATGAIFGAGAGRRLAGVQWGVAGQMAVAWIVTLPAAAAVGAASAWLASTGAVGTILVALVAIAFAGAIYVASRRHPITAENVNDVPAPNAPARAAA